MNVSQQAVEQNNHSVALIEAGKYNDAISTLSNTLAAYKHVVDTDSTASQTALQTSLDDCMALTYSSSNINDGISAMPADFFLYEHGIVIPVEGNTCHETTMVSCIVVFNLALAHQLSSRSGKLSSAAGNISLKKALKLYELAYQLQREAKFDDNVMFTLAVFNNLGLAYSQLRDEKAAVQCFEFVLMMLMFLTDCGHNKRFKLDGFFLNVSTLISPPQAAPAA